MTVRDFLTHELEPQVRKIEETDEMPSQIIQAAAKNGFFGIGIPEKYGGQGGDNLHLAIYNEETARVCQAFSEITMIHRLFTTPILLFGTEEQKQRLVPDIAKGVKFASHATTEPSGGSDVAGLTTVGRRDGGHWKLSGTKTFVTGGDRADFFLVLARTTDLVKNKRWSGLSYFVVDRHTNGLTVGKPIKKLGLRGSHIIELNLDDVIVGDDNMIGAEGLGFKVAMETYNRGRILVAARGVGLAQAAFERSFNYAVHRVTFGKPIIGQQVIQGYLSDILMKLISARLLTYWGAQLLDRGSKEYILAASLAKIYSTEVAEFAASKAISIHGGVGVMSDTLVDRLLRDASITKIYEGTNEIQRSLIIKQILALLGVGNKKDNPRLLN